MYVRISLKILCQWIEGTHFIEVGCPLDENSCNIPLYLYCLPFRAQFARSAIVT